MRYSYLLVCILGVTACTQTPQRVVPIPVSSHALSSPQALKPNVQPQTLTIRQNLVPDSYTQWLNVPGNLQRVQDYKEFLKQHHAYFIVSDYQMFRSARSWEKCHYSEYDVPTPDVWENAVPTLQILYRLKQEQIIDDVEVTSSYRSPILNQCAAGAKRSSHVKNAAIDFRIGSSQPDEIERLSIYQTKLKLCRFWQQHGQALNLGLGIYPTGQVHIDTQGFRTWGADHRWRSSLCGEIIP